MKNRFFCFLLVLSSILFFSCNKSEQQDTAQVLDDCVSWAYGNSYQNVKDAEKLVYTPLELGYRNLSDILGKNPNYVWIKISFPLKNQFRNKQLGLVIPYLHYADRAWLNGTYIGEYGRMERPTVSSFYQAHFYTLPVSALNAKGENVIYLKVLFQGLGTVSEGIIIDEYSKASYLAKKINFSHSLLYMFFAGILICSFVFFLILYMARKEVYILSFTLICLSTIVFITYFYAQELPFRFIDRFGDLMFTKIVLCCGFYITVFTIVSFMMSFIGIEQPKFWIIFKHSVVFVTIIITLIMPDYKHLMKLTPAMIITYLAHFIFGVTFIIRSCFNSELRKRALITGLGFSPLALTMIVDVILRFAFRNIDYPYFAIFGWWITITFFSFYLSIEYGHVYKRNKRLTEDLQAEIDLQTLDLTFANEKLEQEHIQNEREMLMASFVQQKFFPALTNDYEGWDLGMYYNPLEKVSGDIYDFYRDDDRLSGLAVFDASGHGVSAALVTMIAKNIIKTSFINASENTLPVSQALFEVNDRFTKAKGDVENYLTGIMARFIQNGNSTKVELASAGHPYPCFYSAKENNIIELKDLEEGPHFGAIGMAGIEVAFPDIEFNMEKGDVLVAFTDGITEVTNEERQEFGRKRVEAILQENIDCNAQEIVDKLIAASEDFRGTKAREDDITVVVLKKL